MIYLDNAATTKLDTECLQAMLPYFQENYGNPGGLYSLGAKSKKAIQTARRQIAQALDCEMDEIYFTSGGTESDNWAIRMGALASQEKGKHLITSAMEHHGALHCFRELEKQGFRVTYLQPDEEGILSAKKVQEAIRPDTVLISIMYANNEIGTIQPIEEIGRLAKEKGILFHTDAVQAFGHLPISAKREAFDFLSASAHKFYGPKGIGFLYIRKSIAIPNLLLGGNQESGHRPGTENVPAIVGMGVAARVSMEKMEERGQKESLLRDYLIQQMENNIPGCTLTGARTNRLPNHASFVIPGIEGESLLVMLDMKGICASSGSACTVGSKEPSHVLMAINRTPEEAKGSLRLTLSYEITEDEIRETVLIIAQIVGQLRKMSGYK